MQSKVRLTLWILILFFWTGLLSLSILVNQMHGEDLLLVMPTTLNSSEMDSKALEKLSRESFLWSYEIRSIEHLNVLNRNHEITLVKTNYAYPFVREGNLLLGSFFTEQDQREQKKIAVLNKNAAYAMFGNLNIRGMRIKLMQDEYTITGVMEDHTESESLVYIPTTLSGMNPSAFAVRLEEALKENPLKNKCIALGFEENSYHYIALGRLSKLIHRIFFMGSKLILISLLLCRLKTKQSKLRQSITSIQYLSTQFYRATLLKHHPKVILKAVYHLSEMVLITGIVLKLALSSINFFLFWHSHKWPSALNDPSSFAHLYLDMRSRFFFAQALLVGIFISSILILIGVFIEAPSTSRDPSTEL